MQIAFHAGAEKEESLAKCKAQLMQTGFSAFAAEEGCKAIANGADEVEIDDRKEGEGICYNVFSQSVCDSFA